MTTYEEFLEALSFLTDVLEQFQRFHDDLEFDPSNKETYSRKLLIGGAVHHLKNAVYLASQGRTLSAAALRRPGLECVELCWYLSRRGATAWAEWSDKRDGRFIVRHSAIREEMVRAAKERNIEGDIAERLRRFYRGSSAFSHPTRGTLETLYARHEEGHITFEPGLVPDRQTRGLILALFGIVSMALEVVGTLYKHPWPGEQAERVRAHEEVLNERWKALT